MDVHCCNCGEPWDQYYLRHELAGETTAELTADGWQFGKSRLAVLLCPCCPKDGQALPDAPDRKQTVQELAELLGDDEDGLASTLEDFGL
jgi:hypothetical protein